MARRVRDGVVVFCTVESNRFPPSGAYRFDNVEEAERWMAKTIRRCESAYRKDLDDAKVIDEFQLTLDMGEFFHVYEAFQFAKKK